MFTQFRLKNLYKEKVKVLLMQIKYNYVINLDRRQDRWADMTKIINDTCLKNYNFIRFSAIDGTKINEDLITHDLVDHKIINLLKENKISVSRGVIGCLLSHVSVLKKISEDSNLQDKDYVGIFEDDFNYSGSVDSFNKSYETLINTNLIEEDVEFLYIGGRFEPNFICFDDNVFTETSNINIFLRGNRKNLKIDYYERTTSSYIIRKDCCKKVIDLISVNFLRKNAEVIAIDYVYTSLWKDIKLFDYFPHIFYAIRFYSSDVSNRNVKNIQF